MNVLEKCKIETRNLFVSLDEFAVFFFFVIMKISFLVLNGPFLHVAVGNHTDMAFCFFFPCL